MNSEIDLIFGPYLTEKALENGVVYTSCDGDQYGVIKHLIDDLRFWGFELVMAGNIKGFLSRYANPTTIIPEADKRNLDYKMCTSYTDGTKLISRWRLWQMLMA
jgi:predicted homoserine dehydrogenase-like protein